MPHPSLPTAPRCVSPCATGTWAPTCPTGPTMSLQPCPTRCPPPASVAARRGPMAHGPPSKITSILYCFFCCLLLLFGVPTTRTWPGCAGCAVPTDPQGQSGGAPSADGAHVHCGQWGQSNSNHGPAVVLRSRGTRLIQCWMLCSPWDGDTRTWVHPSQGSPSGNGTLGPTRATSVTVLSTPPSRHPAVA